MTLFDGKVMFGSLKILSQIEMVALRRAEIWYYFCEGLITYNKTDISSDGLLHFPSIGICIVFNRCFPDICVQERNKFIREIFDF